MNDGKPYKFAIAGYEIVGANTPLAALAKALKWIDMFRGGDPNLHVVVYESTFPFRIISESGSKGKQRFHVYHVSLLKNHSASLGDFEDLADQIKRLFAGDNSCYAAYAVDEHGRNRMMTNSTIQPQILKILPCQKN